MKQLGAVGLSLIVGVAFGASVPSSALALPVLLWNSNEITAGLTIEFAGSLLLEDTKAIVKIDIVCEGRLAGTVETGGNLLFIESTLTSTGELLTGAEGGDKLECKDETNKVICEVETLEMPWDVVIELVTVGATNVYLAVYLEEAGKAPSYRVKCPNLGEDLCSGKTSARLFSSETEGWLEYFNKLSLEERWGAASGLTSCTLGGAESGLLESVMLTSEGKLVGDTEAGGAALIDPKEPVGSQMLFSVSG